MGRKKWLLAAAGLAAACGLAVGALAVCNWLPEEIGAGLSGHKPTLVLWYTDEALEAYLAKAALEYGQAHQVRILPVQKSGLEYLEAIYAASLAQEDMPDLYIVSNDSLEKAALAGLAAPVADGGRTVNAELFSQTALNAVCYRGQLLGYPLYYETSALVYNRTFLQAAAAELKSSEEALLPETIDDILAFADAYNAPETVEAVFYWDVSDIFYNYFFAGNYIDVGGPCGDDESSIDIDNPQAVEGLKAYQDLNQFFSIDAHSSSYEAVIQDFLDGKTVFTVATTDVLGRLEAAQREGSFVDDYGVMPLPDINETLQSRGLSVTNAVVVNGYSEEQKLANAFAAWLVDEGAQSLYSYTGRMPARRGAADGIPGAEGFALEYEKSAPVPKLMSAANFWVQMEIAYTKSWAGGDVAALLKGLSEQIMTQVTGQPDAQELSVELPSQETAQGAD